MKKILAIAIVLTLVPSLKSTAQKSTFITDTIHTEDKNDFSGFTLIDSIVPQYDVFINGENHTYLDANSRLWVKMFKYLYHNAGVRNIMIEYGYASGWLINEYLQTGDTNLYNIINTYAYKQNSLAYKELMEFNQTLDSSEKIYFTGIDLERGVYSASKVLSMQFPEGVEPNDSIALDVESLKSLVSYNEIEVFDPEGDYNYYNSYDVKSTIDNIIMNFDAHENLYEQYLGPNFALFKRILSGIKDLKVYNQYDEENSTHQFVYRERYMYKQFQKEFTEHGGKFFGQFGRCHITKNTQEETSCNWYNFKSLANRISQGGAGDQDSLKVFTTGIFYHTGEHDEDEMKDMQSHMDKLFARIDDNRLALYDLPNDSLLNNKLENMFNYIVLCTYEKNKEYGGSIADIEEILSEKEDDSKSILAFSGGAHEVNFGPLNTFLGLNDADGFASPIPFWAISFSSVDETLGLNSVIYIGGYIKQDVSINDSVSARMKGFVYKSLTGYNIFKKTEWIDFIPGIGLSYHNLKLDLTRKTVNANPVNGFIGEESISRTKNPALLLDFFSNLNFNLGHFSIGGTFGYSLDLSDPKWKVRKNLLSSSPSTSMTGMFGAMNVGFNFNI
jgi:hypothetical protein